jgi:HJR/Mrr/RecB family endonuclease
MFINGNKGVWIKVILLLYRRDGMARRRYRRKKGSGGELMVVLLIIIGVMVYNIFLKIREAFITFNQYLQTLTTLDWFSSIFSIGMVISIYIIIKKWNNKRREKQSQLIESERKVQLKEKVLRDGVREKLLAMSFREFEYYIADLFSLQGYHAQVTPPSCDGGKPIQLLDLPKLLDLIEEIKGESIPGYIDEKHEPQLT